MHKSIVGWKSVRGRSSIAYDADWTSGLVKSKNIERLDKGKGRQRKGGVREPIEHKTGVPEEGKVTQVMKGQGDGKVPWGDEVPVERKRGDSKKSRNRQ